MPGSRDALRRIADERTIARIDELTSPLPRDDQLRAELIGIIARLANRLAPNDQPPGDAHARALWEELCTTADLLYGSGVRALGRLPFISEGLLELLIAEARLELPQRPRNGERIDGPAGTALASLAVSRKLAQTVGAALGCQVEPARRATYSYDPPGSHVRTHVDGAGYELIFHMILEHDTPRGGGEGSALVVHLPGQERATRLWPKPGEGVALSGRGTIHSWEKLADDESRTMIGIGFIRV